LFFILCAGLRRGLGLRAAGDQLLQIAGGGAVLATPLAGLAVEGHEFGVGGFADPTESTKENEARRRTAAEIRNALGFPPAFGPPPAAIPTQKEVLNVPKKVFTAAA
jgi:hypothetical protein